MFNTTNCLINCLYFGYSPVVYEINKINNGVSYLMLVISITV